jgi:hypothetical protein
LMATTEINTRDGSWVLELRADGTVEVLEFTAAPPRKKWDGLGDVIASATKAVGIKPCTSCEERRKMLNGMMPFGTAEQAAAAAPKMDGEQPKPDAAPE